MTGKCDVCGKHRALNQLSGFGKGFGVCDKCSEAEHVRVVEGPIAYGYVCPDFPFGWLFRGEPRPPGFDRARWP